MMQTQETVARKAGRFKARLPFRSAPYNKKTWGHPFHSLCSYQGKLKPSLAHWLVREFVPARGRLLDPLGGVGTVPFEGALQGRDAVSNDKSPFAYAVATGKLTPPSKDEALRAWGALWEKAKLVKITQRMLAEAEFGLNGAVKDFFHPRTLRELLPLRYLLLKQRSATNADHFVRANLLHILHGNRPYALSRNSHPITPFHPTGPAVYKNVDEKMRERFERVFREELPETFRSGLSINGDFRDLPKAGLGTFDAIITSPPFYGMRFDRPNWMRLWFSGWVQDDFHTKSLEFLERQQTKSLACYEDFFDVCRRLLKPNGLLILHLGSGGSKRFDTELADLGQQKLKLQFELAESVGDLEMHGIRDKGLTDKHHLLFFTR